MHFLNNVVTSTLNFAGKGEVNEYVGDYDDCLRQRENINKASAVKKTVKANTKKASNNDTKKLSFKDQRELDGLPKLIETLDAELEALTENMAAAEFYQQDKDSITQAQDRLAEIEQALAKAYERWEELEE